MSRRVALVLVSMATSLLGLTGICTAQQFSRAGGEFQVNSYTPSYQAASAIAHDNTGNFVVVWVSEAQDGSNSGIFARRFAPDGQPQSAEFRVNTYTPGVQAQPAVARTPGGSFVVVWASNLQDGGTFGVFGRRFDSIGAPLAAEFQVNSYTSSSQLYPSIAVAPTGAFVVLWSSFLQDGPSYGVFGRRFNSSGAPVAVELQISSYTANDQIDSDVAAESDGDFVAVWASNHHDVFTPNVFTRRLSSTGALGPESVVHSFTPLPQRHPAVATDANGAFVVTWVIGDDLSQQDVVARRFTSLGSPIGFEFTVNNFFTFDQDDPTVEMDNGGNFVIAWQNGGADIWARDFNALGIPRGGDLLINSRTQDLQRFPDIGMDGSGDFVVTWSSSNQDGNSSGVFAQRLDHVSILDIDGNGEVAALSDGILVLRYMFGFRGSNLTAGAVGNDCVRCDPPAIEPYLAGLV